MSRNPDIQASFETEFSDAAQQLITEIDKQSAGGPNVERPTAAMFQGILKYGGPQISSLINEAAEQTIVRRGVEVGAAASHFRTTLIHYFTAYYHENKNTLGLGEFSDIDRLSAGDWTEPLRLLEKDLRTGSSMAVNLIYGDIALFDASTPIKERWMGDELTIQIVGDRFPQGARVLEVGSSIGAGALWAVYKKHFPMGFRQALIEPPGRGPLVNVTPNTNKLLNKPSLISKMVCLDRISVYHESRQEWDKGFEDFAISGLRPSERNSEYLQILKSLMDKKRRTSSEYDKDSPISFHQANLLDAEYIEEFKDRFPEPFDVITANYMTQELSGSEQIRLHETLCSLLSWNGILMYVHQAYIPDEFRHTPTNISNIRHDSSYAISKWRSNMHLQDNLHPIKGLQQVMNFYDNRGTKVRFNHLGKVMVNGTLEPFADLIRYGD